MPFTYRIDKEHQLVIGIGKGIVTKQMMLEYRQAIISDKDFNPSYDFIEETKDITDFQMSSVDLQEFAQVFIFNKEARRARIAVNDLIFAVSRMYEAYRELNQMDNFCVFRDIKAALRWINEGREERHAKTIELSFDPFAPI